MTFFEANAWLLFSLVLKLALHNLLFSLISHNHTNQHGGPVFEL